MVLDKYFSQTKICTSGKNSLHEKEELRMGNIAKPDYVVNINRDTEAKRQQADERLQQWEEP